ncbi:MAG: hypothetical protein ACLQVJ_14770 [Syntrophobacteraceae bacterium]
MKFHGKTVRVNAVLKPLIAALAIIWCLGHLDGGAAFSQTSESPATHTVHLEQAHGYPFCEILLIQGKPPDIAAQVYNTSGASDCPPDKFEAIDPKALAEKLHVDAVFKNARRFWMMDRMWLYTGRETRDFDGVKATWMATLPIKGALSSLGGEKRFPAYAPSEIQRVSKYEYLKGTKVFLIVMPDGHTWVMQTYTKVVDPTLSEADLPNLASKLKNLPAGWKFMVKTLDKDLIIVPPAESNHMAHVMADEFDDVYEGCGYDAACNYIP